MIYGSAGAEIVGGVGLLVSWRYVSSIKSAQLISSRVLIVRFISNPELTVVCTYAPTENADGSEKDRFYMNLEGCVHGIPAHSLLIVAGDFNARIGKDSHHRSPGAIGRYAFHDPTNENGEMHVNLYPSV